MSTTTPTTATTDVAAGTTVPIRRGRVTAPIEPVPFGRIVTVELRKAFDTRAGSWLLVAVGVTAVLASVAAGVWAPDAVMTYETFATAIGVPMSVVLPIIAILSVTSEWSQRTGLSTFTLVPRRGRTIAAKAVAMLLVAVVSMLVAMAVGAVGAAVAPALRGLDPVWDTSLVGLGTVVLAQVLGVSIGFVLGVLLRSSAAAIVGYFVFAFVLPTLTQVLAMTQDWFADRRGWFDFGYSQSKLYDTTLTGQEWAQLGVTTTVWILLPLAIGLWRLRRAEIS